ncbi:TPA: FAD-dependent oxidoreductase [Staphylococcus aureus]|uniref:Monomeric sarcosine oxidase, SoxA family, essential for production of diffusible pigment n=1 Tax=Staphylococcus aureus TaxID=1280 RepID=A0A3S7RNS7_STAAU|nr:FAD-dependent oxidoreductase [Staphylococcus aureus]AXQ85973.1 Monomeric sarcosine oxidase, SoxA family, essential for production of diffusible pigment [Staphylococcus aureus]CAC6738309.1 Monomeric sarcosine oxidase [Staphylococcus aureus]SQA04099.1 Monomeric sarcosine oxidase [Staphylococcus aureus]SQE88167.1 Monomeric sarcosine oxidase [Staphylococcus aureus]SUL76140.1 Monomeric sarcosine oxidase [Staphylococcus aureus]
MKDYKVIIIGGGLIGLSTAYNLVKEYNGHPVIDGKDILVLEKNEFFNDKGSSSGNTRQFRYQYTEKYMSDLVIRSIHDWEELQKTTTTKLIEDVGSLWFGDPSLPTTEGGINPAEKTMDQMGIPYKKLTKKQIENWYQFKNLPESYVGFFQKDGGAINLPATLNAFYSQASVSGVQMKENEEVIDIEKVNDKYIVKTGNQEYSTDKIFIATGAYVNDILKHFDKDLKLDIWDMVSAYFEKTDPNIKYPTWFAFQKENNQNSNLYYGFPEIDWKYKNYIRVAPDYPFAQYDNPSERRQPTEDDYKGTEEWVEENMKGLDSKAQFKSTCILALPKNKDKLLYFDFVTDDNNVVLQSGGWSAKFAPTFGKIASQLLVNGHTDYDISHFTIEEEDLK